MTSTGLIPEMPGAIPAQDADPAAPVTVALQWLMERARQRKPTSDMEPPLLVSDFDGELQKINPTCQAATSGDPAVAADPHASYGAIELATRALLYDLIGSTSIEDAAFIQVWNLLDIVSLLADDELCEPGLLFWLVEELLDSQTIDGCRLVFDYLESRRERITAKHFHKKSLIILRSCNELLRRLSRAENTVFCGRVFIFMFQSFPLGDKSSVNLRGEFHTENTTTFEELQNGREAEGEGEKMDVDQEGDEPSESTTAVPASTEAAPASGTAEPTIETGDASAAAPSVKPKAPDDELDLDALYPIFWSLQQYFSNPTPLFEPSNLEAFKTGLGRTIETFTKVQKAQEGRTSTRQSDGTRRGLKRKRGDGDDELASGFNPKYLTSRDLFELEMSDLAFRRHILVQTLILLDFLLSLRPKSKAKLADVTPPNKAVMYAYTLNEDDAKWANETRATVSSYLQEGQDGKFYFRMVDTVLLRDKNWVRWKAEGCPLIKRPPISADVVSGARTATARMCAPKRLRATPLGSLNLAFLASEAEPSQELRKLTAPERYRVPDPKSFEGPIAEDEFDLSMAKEDDAGERQRAMDAKASKAWRALRVASKTRLNVFDRIDTNAESLEPLFKVDEVEMVKEGEPDEQAGGVGKADEGGAVSTPAVEATGGQGGGENQEPSKEMVVDTPVEASNVVIEP